MFVHVCYSNVRCWKAEQQYHPVTLKTTLSLVDYNLLSEITELWWVYVHVFMMLGTSDTAR